MVNADTLETGMLDLINAERAAAGLNPLALEQNLNAAAEDHSEWMLDQDQFSHTGAGGSSPTARIQDASFDLSGSWSTAENIAIQSERGAEGYEDDLQDLHNSLMNSPGHRANLLDPNLEYIGIGIEGGDFNYGTGEYESVVVTQNFASTDGTVDLDTGATPAPEATPTAPEVVDTPATPPETPLPTPVVDTPDTPEPTPEMPVVTPEQVPETPEPASETPIAEPVPVGTIDLDYDCFIFDWDAGGQPADDGAQDTDTWWTQAQGDAISEDVMEIFDNFDFAVLFLFDSANMPDFQWDFMGA